MNATTNRRLLSRYKPILVSVGLILAVTGCETLGPEALRQGRNEYNAAVKGTEVQEFLLNIVRLRFQDKPYVLGLASINSRIERTTELSLSYRKRVVRRNQDFWEGFLGGGVEYSEKPSIVYQPLRGREFVRQLLTPVDLRTMFLLRLSGWEMDTILRVFVGRINGGPNAPTAGRARSSAVSRPRSNLPRSSAAAACNRVTCRPTSWR